MPYDKYNLSESEHQNTFKILNAKMLSTGVADTSPDIIIMGGQPAAGKTYLKEFILSNFYKKKFVELDCDHCRYLHPKINDILHEDEINMTKYTDADIRRWVPALLESGVQNKFNIILQGSLRSKQPISDTISDIKNRGYNVSVAVIACPGYSSKLGMLERYEGQKENTGYGRWTAPETHDDAYKKLPATLRHIERNIPIDRIIVCDSQYNVVYLNQRDEAGIYNVPDKKHDAAFALIKARDIKITKEINEEITSRTEKILQKMEARSATQKEIIRAKAILRNVLAIQKEGELTR